MAPAVDQLEMLISNDQLRHNNNPVLTWCAANAVVVSDPAGNRKIAKDKAIGRVDGIIAALMAIGKVNVEVEKVQSLSEHILKHGIRTL